MSTPSKPQQPAPQPPNDRRLWEYRWVRDLLWIIGALALLWLVYSVRAIAAPVLVGLALAYAVNPIVVWLNRKLRISRLIGTAIILFSGFIFVGALTAYLVPLLFGQTSELIENMPDYAQRVAAKAGPTLNHAGFKVRESLEKILSTVGLESPPGTSATQPPTAPADGADAEHSPTDSASPTATTAPTTHPASRPSINITPVDWTKIGSVAMTSLNVGWNVVGSTISTATYLFLFFIVASYCFFVFSWKFDSILAWFGKFIPHEHRERTIFILSRMDNAVSSFLRGRMIQVFVLGTNLSICWWIAGVPYWALLGMISGMMNIVPYASFIGWPIAVLLIWIDTVTTGGQITLWKIVVWPSLAYIIPQQFDNWIVEPWVQGKATSMDPLSVMLAVMIGASLLGVVGMIIAIPAAACIKIIAQEIIIPRLQARAEKQ